MLTVRQEPPFESSASLAVAPVLCCNTSISDCMAAGMDDMGYEGAATLARVSQKAAAGSNAELHLHAIGGVLEILKAFLGRPGKAFHVREPLKRGLEMLHALCQRKDPSFDHVLRTFLNDLRALAPTAIHLETGRFGELAHLPLAPAYDLTFESSIPFLIQRSAALVKDDPEQPWVNPWRHFLELSDVVFRHYRKLSEIPALAVSQLMFYLVQSVQMIASLYLRELMKARTGHLAHAGEIEGQFAWLLSFLSSSAKHAQEMNLERTDEASKCLGWIGITFLNEGFNGTAIAAVRNICFLATTAGAKVKNIDDQELVRLLMPLRLIAWLAGVIDLEAILGAIEQEEQKAIVALARPKLAAALDRQDRELRQELSRGAYQWLDPNDPEALLYRILERRAAEPATGT